MPAIPPRGSRRPPDSKLEAAPSEAVVSILANLQSGRAPENLSHHQFRSLVQERARSAEQQVWQPLRVAARTRGDW